MAHLSFDDEEAMKGLKQAPKLIITCAQLVQLCPFLAGLEPFMEVSDSGDLCFIRIPLASVSPSAALHILDESMVSGLFFGYSLCTKPKDGQAHVVDYSVPMLHTWEKYTEVATGITSHKVMPAKINIMLHHASSLNDPDKRYYKKEIEKRIRQDIMTCNENSELYLKMTYTLVLAGWPFKI